MEAMNIFIPILTFISTHAELNVDILNATKASEPNNLLNFASQM